MARWLRQSTSTDVPIGPFLDTADGFTALTALTITQPDIRLKKNGGAWAQKAAAQTLSHEENGYYEVTLDATDTNTLGLMRLAVNESGALPVWEEFLVVPANVWDSLFGAALLKVDLDTIKTNPVVNAGTVTFPTTATLASTTNITAGTITNVTSVDSLASGAITAAVIETGAIDADALSASAGTELATAVWASATRFLTAGTNIVLAKGTGVTGFNDLDAAGVRSAVGLASANLDTQLDALPTAAENATAVLTTQMTESYAADGAAPTLEQAQFQLTQYNQDRAIAGTVMSVKKIDGTTDAMTIDLDSATDPTTVSRSA